MWLAKGRQPGDRHSGLESPEQRGKESAPKALSDPERQEAPGPESVFMARCKGLGRPVPSRRGGRRRLSLGADGGGVGGHPAHCCLPTQPAHLWGLHGPLLPPESHADIIASPPTRGLILQVRGQFREELCLVPSQWGGGVRKGGIRRAAWECLSSEELVSEQEKWARGAQSAASSPSSSLSSSLSWYCLRLVLTKRSESSSELDSSEDCGSAGSSG